MRSFLMIVGSSLIYVVSRAREYDFYRDANGSIVNVSSALWDPSFVSTKCKEKGMKASRIESAKDQVAANVLRITQGNNTECWFGLGRTTNGAFYWQDNGEEIGTYTYWGIDQPSTFEGCVGILVIDQRESGYTWHDAPCNWSFPLLCEILSESPSNAPTQPPTLSPFQPPTITPTLAPSITPTIAPTPAPSIGPTTPPSNVPSLIPSLAPTISPSLIPSLVPSSTPTQPPSIAPTTPPSNVPSFAPSNSPTACIDYNSSYNSIDGIDIIDNIEFTESIDIDNEYSSFLIQYISNETNTFEFQTISCNSAFNTTNTDNICFIGCTSIFHCIGLSVIPTISLKELKIVCTNKYACIQAEINITSATDIGNVTIICLDTLSCTEMVINIYTIYDNQLTVHCVEELSCESLIINLFGDTQYVSDTNSVDYQLKLLNTNITCYSDNSCSGLKIITDDSENIYINLLVYRYSSEVLIHHQYLTKISFTCGWFNDSIYIRYDTDDLLDKKELLKITEREYTSRKLPCQDIEVKCTGNIQDISRECLVEYQLTADLAKIMKGKDENINCYWLDIKYLYLPICEGNCNQSDIYDQYNITFELNLKIEDEPETFCEEFFINKNTTKDTLNSIDTIFEYVLAIKMSDSRTIKNVINDPVTILRDNIKEMDCDEIKLVNTINLTTNLTVESLKSFDDVSHQFAPGSIFVNNSRELFEDFFEVSLIVSTDIKNKDTGIFKDEYVWIIIVLGIVGFIILIISISKIYYYYKHKDEKRAIYIQNPMIIAVLIGEYKNPTASDVDNIGGPVEDIPVYIDHEHIKGLCDVLNYPLHTRYDDDQDVNTYWTLNNVMEFLKKKAQDLNNNIIQNETDEGNQYDGLVVFVSCHGLERNIITSDYKKIEKTNIHRLFTTKYPSVTDIPRMFIFDCCSGDNEKSHSIKSKSLQENDNKDNNEEKGDVLDNNNNNSNNLNIGLKQIHNSNSVWGVDENNPDYNLIEINAANVGFQSKIDLEEGSYLTNEFIRRLKLNVNENNHKNKFIFEIFDNIQKQLHKDGKQHIETKYNDGTRYLRFRKKNKDTKNKNHVEMTNLLEIHTTNTDDHDIDA